MKHIWLILFVINSLWGQSFLSKIFPYKDHTLVFSENEKEHQLQVGSFVIIGLKSGDILENKYTGFSITKRKLRMSDSLQSIILIIFYYGCSWEQQ